MLTHTEHLALPINHELICNETDKKSYYELEKKFNCHN